MAVKGARAYLESQALHLYREGQTLTAIGAQLGISVTSLARWKSATHDPKLKLDEWDRARSQKRGNIQRLRDLFEDQLDHLESIAARERTAPMMDTLSKIGSLLERWDKIDTAQRVAEEVVAVVKKAGVTDETSDGIRASILGIGA